MYFMDNKYQLRCTQCGEVVPDFATWFSQNQQCKCGCKRTVAEYSADYHKLDELLKVKNPESFYVYSDFLPIILGQGDSALMNAGPPQLKAFWAFVTVSLQL